MRRHDKFVSDVEWMENVLREGQYACVGFASPDGDPYVLPIGYGYEDGVLYLHGAAKGLKNDMAAANPRVSFSVSVGVEVIRGATGEEFSCKYRSVIGFGEIKEITELAEKNRALAALMRQYEGPHSDMTEEGSKSVWVAKIVVKEMTGKASGYPKP
ncbi:MAG: pyridoxamine 5'-phosphate oxidase family protein [Synergistaceae bacterium]|nr:pyridoxamine 5'-phosphate oxidase family protein [Synergistaceae bacterium]